MTTPGGSKRPHLFDLARPLLHRLPPEQAHRATIAALKAGTASGFMRPSAGRDGSDPARDPILAQTLFGLSFPNPFGLAAGFDKDAEVPAAMLGLGFGFVEVGTVTPRPQPGNPGPRVHRLPQQRAMINRLGFNNAGHVAAKTRLERLRAGTGCSPGHGALTGPIGVNIGANANSTDRRADYLAGARTFAPLADYIMVNVSSPNTAKLRDLQQLDDLRPLLAGVLEAAQTATDTPPPPVLLKIAPDMTREDACRIAALCMEMGCSGLCISNTTVQRDGLAGHPGANRDLPAGGLSGAPLFQRSTQLLAQVFLETGGALPLIGVGGILSGEDAAKKVLAGASLVQAYTGLVYRGPALVTEACAAIAEHVRELSATGVSETGIGSVGIGAIIGRDAATVAGQTAS